MSRLDDLVRRVERLEAEKAHQSGAAEQMAARSIAIGVAMQALARELDGATVTRAEAYCLAEIAKQRAEAVATLSAGGVSERDVADSAALFRDAADEIRRLFDRARRERLN